MQTPDITPMQKLVGAGVAVLASLLTLLAAFGIDLTAAQQAAILGFAGTVGSALAIADAIIRHGRSRNLANPEAIAQQHRYNEKPKPAYIRGQER